MCICICTDVKIEYTTRTSSDLVHEVMQDELIRGRPYNRLPN